jgi:hypothetical protein
LFPALASLALGPAHLAALARQGSLHATGSNRSKRYYKLRFRLGSKQQVRYVGKSPEFVAQIQRELMQLQADTRSAQQLKRLIREANACLRKTKHQLEPLLPRAGRCFYGREIRRWRGPDDLCVD